MKKLDEIRDISTQAIERHRRAEAHTEALLLHDNGHTPTEEEFDAAVTEGVLAHDAAIHAREHADEAVREWIAQGGADGAALSESFKNLMELIEEAELRSSMTVERVARA